MCSPEVAKVVRERVEKEGLANLTRRNFLRVGGLAAAGATAASLANLTTVARAQSESGKVVDLSHVFGADIPTYLENEKPKREDFVTVAKDGFYIQRWNFTEHAGTHVDIPAHFIADGKTVDEYDADLLVSPAVVIDISAKAATNADAALDVKDIEAWESANGKIPEDAVVLMYSGWDARWSDAKAFRNADKDGVQHYPGFSPEAAKFLVEQRDIRGIGVDTLSLDIGKSTTFDVHVTILAAGKYGIEGLANLAAIKDKKATLFVGVPRWEKGSGGPARVLAVI